jgi:hypothetical protein
VKESGPRCVVQVRQVYQANARCLKKRYEGRRRRSIGAGEDVGAEDGTIGGVEKGTRIYTPLDLADDMQTEYTFYQFGHRFPLRYLETCAALRVLDGVVNIRLFEEDLHHIRSTK